MKTLMTGTPNGPGRSILSAPLSACAAVALLAVGSTPLWTETASAETPCLGMSQVYTAEFNDGLPGFDDPTGAASIYMANGAFGQAEDGYFVRISMTIIGGDPGDKTWTQQGFGDIVNAGMVIGDPGEQTSVPFFGDLMMASFMNGQGGVLIDGASDWKGTTIHMVNGSYNDGGMTTDPMDAMLQMISAMMQGDAAIPGEVPSDAFVYTIDLSTGGSAHFGTAPWIQEVSAGNGLITAPWASTASSGIALTGANMLHTPWTLEGPLKARMEQGPSIIHLDGTLGDSAQQEG